MAIETTIYQRYTCDICGKTVDNEGEFDKLHKPVPPDKWMFKRVGVNHTRLVLCPKCADTFNRSLLLQKGWSERQGDDVVRSVGKGRFDIEKFYDYNAD